MNKAVADIFHDALRLPMAARAELAGELIRTLHEANAGADPPGPTIEDWAPGS